MSHFRILKLFVLRKILSLKNDILNDGDDLSSFDSFLFDIFFLCQVEMISRRGNNIHEGFVEEDEIKLSLNFFWMSFIISLPEFVCIKIVVVSIFKVSHFEVKFTKQKVVIVNLIAFFKNIFGDLNRRFYSLNGEVILTELFQADRRVYNGVNKSSIVYVFFSDLNALVKLSLCFLKKFVFIQIIGVFEECSPVLDLTVVFLYKF